MTSPLRFFAWLAFCIPFIAILSCGTIDRKKVPVPANTPVPLVESQSPQTFLANYRDLKKTTAFRQNIWLGWNHGQDPAQIALCVDLRNQVYLVIRDSPTVRSQEKLPGYYQNLSVSVPTLRARMDPDAFVLHDGNLSIAGIFRVPDNPPESFAADVINQLLDKRITPEDLTFQAD